MAVYRDRVAGSYVSKSERDPFWYETQYKKPFDHVFYKVRDQIVKYKAKANHDWYADRISYSVTKPDLSY